MSIQKIRIQSKRLKSGKCQVKFYTNIKGNKSRYGYLLTNPDQTLRDVVLRIIKLSETGALQDHLFDVRNCKQLTTSLVFNNP